MRDFRPLWGGDSHLKSLKSVNKQPFLIPTKDIKDINIATKTSKLKRQTESDIGHFLQSLAMFSFVCFFLKTDANTKTYWILPKSLYVCFCLCLCLSLQRLCGSEAKQTQPGSFQMRDHWLPKVTSLFFPILLLNIHDLQNLLDADILVQIAKKNLDIQELPKVAFFAHLSRSLSIG